MTVASVMARYELRDRRAARRVMDEAGAFRIGAGIFVRLDDLLALEEELWPRRRRQASGGTDERPLRRRSRRAQGAAAPLAPGWWRPAGQADRRAG